MPERAIDRPLRTMCNRYFDFDQVYKETDEHEKHITTSQSISNCILEPSFSKNIMTFQRTVLQLAACSAIAYAQSANIGLGTNPDAQGATEEVTPGAGPNG